MIKPISQWGEGIGMVAWMHSVMIFFLIHIRQAYTTKGKTPMISLRQLAEVIGYTQAFPLFIKKGGLSISSGNAVHFFTLFRKICHRVSWEVEMLWYYFILILSSDDKPMSINYFVQNLSCKELWISSCSFLKNETLTIPVNESLLK